MPGVLGLYMFDERWKIATFGRYGLLALQHRGQETAGLVTLKDDFCQCLGRGWVDDVITQAKIKELEGHLCVGQVSPYAEGKIQPLILEKPKKVAFALDGKITSIEGYDWNENLSYEENLLNALASELRKVEDTLEGVKSFFSKCKGGYSFVVLTQDRRMIAGRDPRGIKPLVLAKIGFDGSIVASETCATDTIGERMPVSPAENIEPGEIRIFTPWTAYSERMANAEKFHCGFEYVYLARPDSYINNAPIYKIRREIGRKLVEESPADADIIVGVPETAIPFAMCYSNVSGIPIEKGFEQTGRRVRSAIKPTQLERLKGVQLKLNVISEAVRGKRLVLIDDSVVRGNTLANIVYLMKEKGAKEIHVRIGSPHIIAPCPYGTEVPPADELIGKHLSEEKIAEVVGADSFHYLSLEGLVDAIGLPKRNLCLACFTGEHPRE
ncbi:MAG: amidophosphoribosyltransferase [Hadesarchaea archaeon]|nr:amidophosphoribosyltransferase [Hadesarchaea archaeon]